METITAPETLRIIVADSSHVAEARRLARAEAGKAGFNEVEQGKVALVVTEMASNLLKHTSQGGELLLGLIGAGDRVGLQLLSLDRGPGIANVSSALRDGFSTTRTSGGGLGAIRRLSALFDIYSVPGQGTALLAQLWADPAPAPTSTRLLQLGALRLALPGQAVCGDAWGERHHSGQSQILLADGLGHGLDAAEAAGEAVKIFQERAWLAPVHLLETMHAGIRHTRGAAVAVAQVDIERREVHFAGIGNITGVIISQEDSRHLLSHNGTAGHIAPRFQEFVYAWPDRALLVLHTDGLTNRWNLESYPGLSGRHPALIAGVLYRDFQRGRDDVAIVVARQQGGD